jgi:hypothetical protein
MIKGRKLTLERLFYARSEIQGLIKEKESRWGDSLMSCGFNFNL